MTSALQPPIPCLPIAVACLCALIALLGAVVIGDIRHRRIPNRVCGAIALLALPWWLAASAHPLGQIGQQGLILLAVALPLLGLFALRVYGGGDVKLIAALLFWIPADELMLFLVVTTTAGGLVALLILAGAKLRRTRTPTVPYGVAIAIGAIAAMAEPLRTHLAGGGI